MPKPRQLEIPFPKEEPMVRIPVGTRISYPWYGTSIFGEVVEDDKDFPGFQCARLEVQGTEVLVIINPNKATVS